VGPGGARTWGILKVDHPDVLEFIDCKLDGGITNFNISVAGHRPLHDALAAGGEYDLINPHTGLATGRLSAKEVFDEWSAPRGGRAIPAWSSSTGSNASPANPTPEIGVVEATNPCGEQPLLPNEACNLGSLNVSKFAVVTTRVNGSSTGMRWSGVVRLAVRFLDDVIEMNPYPLRRSTRP